jgi:hypothetical protein
MPLSTIFQLIYPGLSKWSFFTCSEPCPGTFGKQFSEENS